MNFQSIRSLAKPFFFWSVLIAVGIEVFLHYKICDLPYKFLNHTTGPVHKLGQYSKDEVIPKGYLAIVGDSNVYGYGPWLYENSWSMEQPSFASSHLLHGSLKKDVISFGFPGFGSLGSSLSMVSELQMLKNSWIWPEIEDPLEILFVFYEGNDLINNLHEVEQRGLNLNTIEANLLDQKLAKIITNEEKKLSESWAISDHSAAWNLFSGLTKNYYRKLFNEPKQYSADIQSTSLDRPSISQDQNSSKPTNIANISGVQVHLGFCEDPALLLNETEIALSLKISEHSLRYLRSNFPDSKISLIYLPSSLSIYNFGDCEISPTPLVMMGQSRAGLFKPIDAIERNKFLRAEFLKIAQKIGTDFWDTTDHLKEIASNQLLHGPRDPIHLNRAGYEAFTESILSYLKPQS
ncbi:SGNH/GDSL hydrolase family protein [Opitutales bacterium]|nr:SGNH/GDSL hydrolase family protein [Opitutales bacterium]